MKIAYLILAHKNLDQLALLIDLLNNDTHNYCFIHLDRKMHASSVARKLNKSVKSKNWHLIERRIAINWGAFSMVEATLNLILEALNFNDVEFDYLSLHSGLDMPLQSNERIMELLGKDLNKQYLDFFVLPNYNRWTGNGGLDRLDYYWFLDELGQSESLRLVEAQKTGQCKRNWPMEIGTVYGGSQWWTLTAECCKHIINLLKKSPIFYHFFKHSLIPDEFFFQTILLNSKYKGEIINNNLRYIDFESGPGVPRVFDLTDLIMLEQSDKLFARKFDKNVSDEIIEHFKQKLL